MNYPYLLLVFFSLEWLGLILPLIIVQSLCPVSTRYLPTGLKTAVFKVYVYLCLLKRLSALD